jgi:hypothetical protein
VCHRPGDDEPDGAAERIEAARGFLGVLDLAEDFARAIEERDASVGHCDAAGGAQQPGGAQQQRDAETGFEFTDDARHRRLRQPEFAPRARKTAALRRAHENCQFLQPVAHLYCK